MNTKKIEWILRIAVFGEFFGHGIFALQGKASWIKWIGQLIGTSPETSATLLILIGIIDLVVAIVILLRPINIVILWAVFWGFWTALVRPLVGESFWDFIERWANWGAPLALYWLTQKSKK